MSEKTKAVWQNLPDLIFGEIMMMLMGLEELQKCRQVCQKWNVMISQMTRLKKDQIRRKAESLAHQIKKRIGILVRLSLPLVWLIIRFWAL